MDLWIGDQVKVISTGQIGKYEGETLDGKAKIKIGDNHILVQMNQLVLLKEEDGDEPLIELELESESTSTGHLNFQPIIDLHIEVLDPSRTHDDPNRIREFQIKRCAHFIQQAIRVRAAQVKIIHGKGTGALKTEVLHLLAGIPEVFIIQETHNGGAQECIMNYR